MMGGAGFPRQQPRRTSLVLVGAIVLLATAMRLPALLGDGFWRDEANVYVELVAPSFAEFLQRVTLTEWHPPLYFLIMYGWTKIAGTSELALTIVPFTFSVATVAVIYRLGSLIDSRACGALAAGMYAVAPLPVAYSDEHVYSLLLFVSALFACAVAETLRARASRIRLLVLAGATAMVVATHYTGLLYVALVALCVSVHRTSIWHRARVVAAIFAGVIPFIVWLPVFVHQERIGLPFGPASTALDRCAFVGQMLLGALPLQPTPLRLAFLTVMLVALLALVRAGKLNWYAAAFGLMYLVALVILASQNLLSVRYSIAFYGLFCVFTGSLLTSYCGLISAQHPRRWKKFGVAAVAALLIGVVASDAAGAVATSAVPKSGIAMIRHRPATDAATLYILAPDYLASTFAFYARASPIHAAGFVRWQHPEVFRIADYATDWNRPDAVARTLRAVDGADHRLVDVDVVVDDRAHDSGTVPYGKVGQLLAGLRARYHFLGRTPHPGRYEPVSEYRFARR
jgi:4-amino-4-deoxy-L-arabinose transferase-like glycosyltransferase